MEEKAKKQNEERDRDEAENNKLQQQIKELKEQRDTLNERYLNLIWYFNTPFVLQIEE